MEDQLLEKTLVGSVKIKNAVAPVEAAINAAVLWLLVIFIVNKKITEIAINEPKDATNASLWERWV